MSFQSHLSVFSNSQNIHHNPTRVLNIVHIPSIFSSPCKTLPQENPSMASLIIYSDTDSNDRRISHRRNSTCHPPSIINHHYHLCHQPLQMTPIIFHPCHPLTYPTTNLALLCLSPYCRLIDEPSSSIDTPLVRDMSPLHGSPTPSITPISTVPPPAPETVDFQDDIPLAQVCHDILCQPTSSPISPWPATLCTRGPLTRSKKCVVDSVSPFSGWKKACPGKSATSPSSPVRVSSFPEGNPTPGSPFAFPSPSRVKKHVKNFNKMGKKIYFGSKGVLKRWVIHPEVCNYPVVSQLCDKLAAQGWLDLFFDIGTSIYEVEIVDSIQIWHLLKGMWPP